MNLKINNSIIELIEGDITELATDAIVNPANAQFTHFSQPSLPHLRRSKKSGSGYPSSLALARVFPSK